ncbi:MAG TPA: hypothetical protein VFX61_16225 [Micromonosporaceae bacterium]|nr:hypothetical protein [Micromonosporaceae bacterium]
MTRAAEADGAGSPVTRARIPPRVPRRGDLGFGALIVSHEPAPTPATNASWAWSLRRFARGLIITLPLYAVLYGLVTLGRFDGSSLAPYLRDGRGLQVFGWLVSIWVGLVALMAISAVLASARSRRTAVTGLLLGLAGAVMALPFTALPSQSETIGVTARTMVLAGATVQTLAWLVTGWAVARSGVFATGDGLVLMLAAPMLGIVGLLVGPLQTVGALLLFAAGLGMWRRAGRSLPTPSLGDEAHFAAR